jgi:hypothetical protein
LVLMAILTTFMASPLFKLLYKQERKLLAVWSVLLQKVEIILQ